MNLKNIKIATQLKLGFATLLLFVIILGTISYIQTYKIHQQTENMYNHPLKVRRALGEFKSDILLIHRNMKDLFLPDGENRISLNLAQNEVYKSNAFEQLNILYSQYLGPRSDIDTLKQSFIIWNSVRDETVSLLLAGKTKEAAFRTSSSGEGGRHVEVLLVSLATIDVFAMNKGEELYTTSVKLNNSLNRQLIILVAVILILSLIINYVLLRNVRNPLDEIINAAKRFHEGDFDARSTKIANNEFGELSDSFNKMVENIQIKTELDEKFADLSSLMLSEYDIKKFFQSTLNALAVHTGSQMAAIYLRSEDKKSFKHFESLGVGDNARQSFASEHFEGEFGTVLSTRKIHHLKNIPEDTRFVFHTVSGKFIPREIITLPVLANNEVVAIISLSSISTYSKQSIQLTDRILVTLCSRIEGILAYHKTKELLQKLEQQNIELESQSAELYQQNTELEMQKKQLNEANKLKTNFLSNMSHELRTPLNSVIALSGVLNRRLATQIPKEEYSYLDVIERNGKHLLGLINDILDISRIEAGHEEIEVTKFDANNLIAELVSMINPQAEQKNTKLIHSNRSIKLSITSDTEKCRHILQNLISNAVKFTENGKVEIIATQQNENISITITDTGIGIEEKYLPHIFDEFRQADSSTSRRFGGTGLGLAIAKKYANLLGGNVTVKSKHGTGSEFTLILPLHYTSENRIIEEGTTDKQKVIRKLPAKPTSAKSVKTILLVEDSEPAIIQMKDFLEESGYKILVACNGENALEIISKTIPDAMILDLMMPGIDGFELLKILRENETSAHIPVLILTAKHITKDELSFLKHNNIHQLIQKGDVNRDEILNAVATMVIPKAMETMISKQKMQTIKGKPVVLVVEDNHDNMTTVKAILSDNYIVIEATDGITAIEMAKNHLPNLILMDIELPRLDGISAFKTIRNTPQLRHIPVIALTASAINSEREVILSHGFDSYIAKPIDEKVFFKTIKEVLYGN